MVEIEDRYVTSTPEGVPLSFVLAGLGSRASAYLIDVLVQVIVDLIAFLALSALVFSSTSAYVEAGIYSLILFVVTFGYFVMFETLDSGRSLGKRALGIRVTRIDGSGVTFRASLVRNLLRVLYVVPIFYLVDALLILASKRNQRLGDLLAGTLVIRDRLGAVGSMSRFNLADPGLWSGVQAQSPWGPSAPGPAGPWTASPGGTHPWGPPQPGTAVWGPPGIGPWGPPAPPRTLPPELAVWDVSQVTPADLVVVQAYL